MRRLLAVLAVSVVLAVLTELCSGFQPGFRYVYHANWNVNAGIPEINLSKKINSTIDAYLSVSIDEDYERIDFLLTNVTLKKTGITLDGPGYQIENSFSFRIDPKHGIYIKDNSSDNNFYLAIVSQIMPFLPNLTFWDHGQHNVSPLEESASYITYRHESNILGTLPVVYTKRALTESEAYLHRMWLGPVEGDRVGDCLTSDSHYCPNSDDDIHLVKRFVQQDCKMSLSYYESIQSTADLTGGSNKCRSGFSQYYKNSYYVRKSSGSLTVEKIVTSGNLEVSPAMRDGSEHFVSESHSIFRLVYAKPFVKKHLTEIDDLEKLYTSPVANAVVGYTLPQQLDAMEPGKLSKPFDGRWDGQLETETATKINLYTDALTSRNLDDVNRLAHYPREIKIHLSLLGFDLQIVKRNLANSKGRDLFHDILATTGTEAAVRELLNNKDEWSNRQVLVDTSMMIHLRSPSALPKLKKYVLEESDIDKSPFATSQRIINFATVLGTLCMTEMQDNDVEPRDPCPIKQQFIASISQKLEATDIFWKQMVYVKALVNLKYARLSEILMPYVMNEKPVADVAVRLLAIDSLASWNNADSRKAVQILFFLLENPMESREVKARALGILSSHPKSAEDWNRLAMFTHRSECTDLSAVMYFSIKAVSELEIPSQASSTQLARKALLLAKPAPAAERYSSFYTWVKYCFRNQLTRMDYVALIKNPASPVPHNLAMVLRSQTMGGLSVQSKMETVITNGNNHGSLESLVIALYLNMDHSQRVKISEYADWSKYNNDTTAHSNEDEREETIARGLFSWLASIGAQIFIPLEHEFIADIFKHFSLYGMHMEWHGILDSMGSHYITSFNEMGLPLRLQSFHPTSISFKGSFQFANTGPRKHIFSTSNDTHLLISDEYTSNLELKVPFQSHTIGVGFKQRKTVNLPLFYDVSVLGKKHGMMPRMVAASIVKQVDDIKTEAYSHRNVPYLFTTSEYLYNTTSEKVSEIFVSGNKPLQPEQKKSFNFIEHTFSNDFVNNRPDEHLLNKFIDYFTGKDECQVLPNSLKFSSGNFVINYGTRNPMEFQFNFTNAEMERDPSVKYTGKHYSRSNNRIWEDPKNLQKQEGISPTFIQWENRTTDPQLWDFMRFLRQHHVWKNGINAMSVHLEVAEYPVRYPWGLWGPWGPWAFKPPAEYDDYKNLTTKHFVAEAMTAAIYNHSSKGEKRSFKTAVLSIKNYGEYCVDQFGTQPKLNNMDLHMDLLMKNLTKIIYTRVYSGNGCNLNIMNITETGLVTRKQRSSLRSAARQLRGNDDQLQHFHRTAVYDDWNKTVSVGDNLNQTDALAYSIGNAWIKVQSLFWKSPLAAEKMLASSDRHYSIKFSRKEPLTWGIHAHSQYHDPVISYDYEAVLDHEWLESSSLVTYESDYKFEETCVISPNMVKTFDELSVPVNSSCLSDFAILVNDWGNWRKKVAIMVLFREGSFEVKLIDIDSKAKMFFKSSELPDRLHVRDWDSLDGFSGYYLNSTESYWNKRKSLHGDHLECDIFQQDGKFKIDIKDVGHIYIHPREIRIALDKNYRGKVGGLCGNWDLNPANDLQGPRGCPLHGTDQFQLAWYLPHQAFDERYPWYYHWSRTESPVEANSTSMPAPEACQRYVEQDKCFNL